MTGRGAADVLPPAFVAQRTLTQRTEGQSEQWCVLFYIVERSSGLLVGTCGFKGEPTNGGVEIGYGVGADYRGRGYATESVRALLAVARALDPAIEVLAQINPDNHASTRVVQKLNFVAGETKLDQDNERLVQWRAK